MLIKLKNVQKTYCSKNGVTFRALNNVSLTFDSTGLVYLVGASGSGKSTLLNVIGGLDGYDSGDVIIAGKKLNAMKNTEIDSLRNTLMGFVFQEFNLIDTLSVYDNVRIAMDMQSRKDDGEVMRALEEMGIADKAKNKTKDLSGGQRQRVAIARALVKNPRLILADEPTGSLDSTTSAEVISILKKMSETRLVIVVTHDMETAIKTGDRIIEMKDGKIYRDVRKKKDGEIIEKVNAQMYSDTLMVVPGGAQINDADAEKINDALSRSVRKTYVTVESDPRKVKALYPNLREAVGEFKEQKPARKKSKDDEGDPKLSSDEFVPFSGAVGEMENAEFKRGRLSFLRTVKLAFNNLSFKKVRLVLTVIVAFLAFVLFGVSQSFASYDLRAAVSKTLEKENITRMALASSRMYTYSYGDNTSYVKRITNNELAHLSKRLPNAKFTKQYDIHFDRFEYFVHYSLENFKGVVEIDDISECGYELMCGKGSCDNFDEVIISEYAALSIWKNQHLIRADSIADLIGKTLPLEYGGTKHEYKIVGVFKCKDAERWMMQDSKLLDTFGSLGLYMLQAGGWGQLYTKKGFAEEFFKNRSENGIALTVHLESKNAKLNGDAKVVFDGGKSAKNVIPVTPTGAIEREGDLIVEAQMLFSVLQTAPTSDETKIKSLAEAFNAEQEKKMSLRDKQVGALYVSDDLRIVGVTLPSKENIPDVPEIDGYDTLPPEESALSGADIYMSESVQKNVTDSFMVSTVVYATYDAADCRKLVDAADDYGLQFLQPFMVQYDTAEMVLTILHWVLLIVSLIFCLLVVILLFTFISTSIKLTSKHIGILRALGAKKIDTFMIYALEGILVTMCALVIAIIVIAAGAPLLNVMISAGSGYYFALLTVTAPVYLTMFAVAIIVTVLSIIIPLRKFNKITPVSAISGKE